MMKWIYSHLVNYGRIRSIESLDIEEKKEIWQFVCDVCAGKTNDIIVKKEIVMAFCAIEFFINENKSKC
jgi:hypothetical protein